MTDIDELQKKLKAFADTVNLFKSEAVQLRVVDALLGRLGVPEKKVAPASRSRSRSRSSSKARRRRREKTSDPSSQSQARAPRKSSRGSGSPGASAAISDLLASGFFRAPKTIGQIVEHCASARGHRYKANECSPPLLRLLRDGKLERKKNKDGQYEYTQT